MVRFSFRRARRAVLRTAAKRRVCSTIAVFRYEGQTQAPSCACAIGMPPTTERSPGKATIPGYGWSCPIVWGDRVFVTTAVSDKQKKPGGGGGGGNPPPDAIFRWEVHCLDRATGKTLWQQVAAERKPTIGNHLSNTYA